MTDEPTTDVAEDELPEDLRRRRAMTPAQWQREARALEAKLTSPDAERGDLLTEAAHAWEQGGDFDAAERCHQQLLVEPRDPDMADPRVPYALFLFERRDPERGRALLQQLWDERDTDPTTYVLVAESHEQWGALQEALTWCNAGLARCYPEPFDPVPEDLQEDWLLTQLVSTRTRLRQSMHQPADALDELLEVSRQRIAERLESAPPASEHTSDPVPVEPYWPQEEFEEAMREWPETIQRPDYPAVRTHSEHRREIERSLRQLPGGKTPRVVWVRAADFRAFRQDHRADDTLTTLLRYAELGWGSAVSWPPGRNDSCWCGSARKYKKCCGGPGFIESATSADG